MYMKDGLHLSGKGAAVFAEGLAAVDSGIYLECRLYKLEFRFDVFNSVLKTLIPLVLPVFCDHGISFQKG